MPRSRSWGASTTTPIDENALAIQRTLEQEAEVLALEAVSLEHESSAARLLAASDNAVARGTSLGLAIIGAVMIPLALISFATAGGGIALAAILVSVLLAAGLLLTDRTSPTMVGAGQNAIYRSTALILLGAATVGLLGSSRGFLITDANWAWISVQSLVCGALLLLPGFTADEITRHRAFRHRAQARTARLRGEYARAQLDVHARPSLASRT